MLDYTRLIQEINKWSEVNDDVFGERLKSALNNYVEYVLDGVMYNGYNDLYDVSVNEPVQYIPTRQFKLRLRKLCKAIIATYDDYNNGVIAKCIENKWWKRYEKDWTMCTIMGGGPTTYYRMRSKTEGTKSYKMFNRKDLFHVPYEHREAIKSYRYSMIGMPCLYLGCSMYVCWEEMRRSNMNNLMVSAFKLSDEYSLNLLDLRLVRRISNAQELEKYLMTLPLMIACSFKVKSEEGIYKPEYVFPQLVMHMIVKDCASNRKIDGVYFDSTQQEEDFKNYIGRNLRMIENIAVPVYEVAPKGYCKRLSNMFTLTLPTTKEYEENKEPLFGIASSKKEENTLFYAMEERLGKMDFKPIHE